GGHGRLPGRHAGGPGRPLPPGQGPLALLSLNLRSDGQRLGDNSPGMNTRRILELAVALLALSPAARAATGSVSEVGTSFEPAQIEVVPNDQVVWTNRSTQTHTVTFDNGPELNP